jgi:hypothetical protein
VALNPKSNGIQKSNKWIGQSNFFFNKLYKKRNRIMKEIIFYFKRTREEIRNELQDLVKHMINEFYEPDKNNLKERSS